MKTRRETQHGLIQEIVGRLARRYSTAVVLFHHMVAEHLGLGPADHKCLDLLRDQGAMTGSDLGAITGSPVVRLRVWSRDWSEPDTYFVNRTRTMAVNKFCA